MVTAPAPGKLQDMPPLRMVIVTPVYQDAENLAITAMAMERQTHPPDLWMIVDDGSLDETPDVAEAICAGLPFARLLRIDPQDKSDGLATASEATAFNAGLRAAGDGWDLIGKFDSDLDFPADYLARLVEALDADPALGLVGGHLLERHEGELVDMDKVPDDHVRGATKLYRAACFADIGGIEEVLGWDTLDEMRAQMHGWRTRSLHGLGIVHLRPRASRGGALKGARRLGRCAHAVGYDPLFVLVRTGWIAGRAPKVLGALSYLAGWLGATVRRDPRIVTPQEQQWLRRAQRRRLLRGGRQPAQITDPTPRPASPLTVS